MPALVVIGAQWGDEGKGKVVDLFSEHADVVVRYAGGANAGHTLVIDGQKLVTHLVPSGVLHKGTICVIGDGTVIDPHTLVDEIAECRSRGLLPENSHLVVGHRAHVILPYHKQIEALREKQANAIGTTLRGIGPAYEAKAARRGVRVGDLLRPDRLRTIVQQNIDALAPVVEHMGEASLSVDTIVSEALAAGEKLAPHIGDASVFLAEALGAGKNVLFEGAQGALLDVDHGTYPYVTSSSTIAGGACTGTGVGPTSIDDVIGITKAYTTRVGAGPFPTELDDAEGEALRQAGDEFGATTGRPRRCGWLDIPALRHAARINGLGGLAITKLDVLRGLPQVRVCVAYELDGKRIESLPMDAEDVGRLVPVYESLPGWEEDLSGARSIDDLPVNARAYAERVAQLVGVDIVLVSVGPDRAESIHIKPPFGG